MSCAFFQSFGEKCKTLVLAQNTEVICPKSFSFAQFNDLPSHVLQWGSNFQKKMPTKCELTYFGLAILISSLGITKRVHLHLVDICGRE